MLTHRTARVALAAVALLADAPASAAMDPGVRCQVMKLHGNCAERE